MGGNVKASPSFAAVVDMAGGGVGVDSESGV